MKDFLNAIGLPGLAALFVAFIVAVTLLLKGILLYAGKKALQAPPVTDPTVKKHADVDVRSYAGIMQNMGMIISLALVLAIFEFPTYDKPSLVELSGVQDMQYEEIQDIPPTVQEVPPPPKIKHPEIVAVADEVEIINKIEIDLDMEMDPDALVEEFVPTDGSAAQTIIHIEEEKPDEIFTIVEEPAKPKEGYTAFYQFIADNLRYPSEALRTKIQGKVYVQFIVDKNGNLSNLTVLRGIGGGCDEEAIRVLSMAPAWTPGKQRGKAVKQYMVIPIHFRYEERL